MELTIDHALKKGVEAHKAGKLEEADRYYTAILKAQPKHPDANHNMGVLAVGLGKVQEALPFFKTALETNPSIAQFWLSFIDALIKLNRVDDAKAVLDETKSKGLKGDGFEQIEKRLIGLEKGIEVKVASSNSQEPPKEQLQNLIYLYTQGQFQKALAQGLELLKDFPNSINLYDIIGAANIGLGKLDEAIEAYNKTLSIKPDYTSSYWNLYGTSGNIKEAKKWIEKCLKVDPNHEKAKLTLSALKFYDGDKSEFGALTKSPLKDHPHVRSFNWTFSLPKLPPLYFNRWSLFDQMTKLSKKNRPFYEFGVWRGEAFKYLIKTFKKGYGFDTFEGLPEDWHNEKAGTYSSEGNIPNVDGGEFIVGKFEDTLPDFFSEKRPMASIINFDADLYSSTICALHFSKPVIDEHTILIFDEFIINENWEEDEYKALEEFCVNNKCTYEVLAVSFFTKQVAVKIIGI